MEESLRLAQRQVKEQSERECSLDRDTRLNLLPTAFSSLWRCPRLDGLVTDPEGDIAAIAQGFVILRLVVDAIGGLVFWMPVGSFVGFGHGDHRWLSGFVMAPACGSIRHVSRPTGGFVHQRRQQVSEEVAHELIQSPSDIDSKTYDLTIMFVDIRDFTVFADSREPAEVARFQNIVFGELIEIVRAHHGIVLQILGDGIMAVFGAPVVSTDHADNAITAGYQMVQRVQELGEAGTIPPIKIGIGLNAGTVIAGNVGNASRRFYPLIGKNVIIAARIEQLNKDFDSQFLVSESVYRAQQGLELAVEDLGDVTLKGIEQPVGVYKWYNRSVASRNSCLDGFSELHQHGIDHRSHTGFMLQRIRQTTALFRPAPALRAPVGSASQPRAARRRTMLIQGAVDVRI